MDFANKLLFGYESLEDAFPECDPGVEPFGSRVLVQFRSVKKRTAGGVEIPDEVLDTEHYNTQVAKVLALGPLAFHNRSTGQPWPEGMWCKPGDYVRVAKYGGDRWDKKVDGRDVLFVIFNDLDIIGKVSDPLAMKAFL